MSETYTKPGTKIVGERIRVEARKFDDKGRIDGSSFHNTQLMIAKKSANAIIEKSYRSRFKSDGRHPSEHKID